MPSQNPPCPDRRPQSLDPAELRFERREMVNWFGPLGLAITALEAAMSSVFGSYADKREVQGAFPLAESYYDRSKHSGDFALDYVADLGDGFDATYTVAYLLAQRTLTVSAPAEAANAAQKGGGHELPRGRLLVMGGDQVYPTAKLEEYRDRLLGPYGAALPCVVGEDPPEVFAIPGNHDWYDGLTTFLRLFCQSRPPLGPRWMGGWKTGQDRSYFALRLPHGWWLWGIDVQLKSEFDKPQLEYFLDVAKEMDKEEGQRLILVTAQPRWIHSGEDDPAEPPPRRLPRRSIPSSTEFSRLAYFEREVVRKSGARLAVVLSGDLHHYCRYQEAVSADRDPRSATQRITCGGGGAFLHATHQMPPRLALAEEKQNPPVVYRRRQVYPGERRSKQLAGRVWWRLPIFNVSFFLLLGTLYLLFGWILESVSLATRDANLATLLTRWPDPVHLAVELWRLLVVSPAASAFALSVIGALFGYGWSAGRAHRPWLPILGAVHGFAHVGLAFFLVGGFARFNIEVLDLTATAQLRLIVFVIVEMLLVGGFLGALLFALYLLFASRLFTAHTNEVMSSQRIADYKCFLRLVIGADGDLRIYPIGVDRVSRKWKAVPDAAPEAPWIEPDSSAIEPQLIEEPIRVS